MKKTGILHADLSRLIASMGHGESLVIGDAGLPAPPGVPVIDLALCEGVPTFLETLEVVLREFHVERAIIDDEMATVSPAMRTAFDAAWPDDVPFETVPHADLQVAARDAKAMVRTGEFTPYSNIILIAGVVF
jgi:ABC-type ribose transport system, auxiliary component